MARDAMYDFVHVKKQLFANNIQANSITLHDTTLRSNIHTSGRRVKELYESQQDTNCFSDNDRAAVTSFRNACNGNEALVFESPVYHRLYHHSVVNPPTDTYCICADDTGCIVVKANVNGVNKIAKCETWDQTVGVELCETDCGVSVSMRASSSNP